MSDYDIGTVGTHDCVEKRFRIACPNCESCELWYDGILVSGSGFVCLKFTCDDCNKKITLEINRIEDHSIYYLEPKHPDDIQEEG